MIAAAAVMFTAAACVWLGLPAFLLGVWLRERRNARTEAMRRAQQDREVTPEWLAVLAATEPTPIYDRLVCEQMERAEGWAS